MSHHSILIGELQKELSELEELTLRTETLLRKLQTTGDEDYVGTLALNLHSFYSGAERAFQAIAATIDDSLPNQQDWHRRLLRQMNIAIPETRPAVLTQSTYTGLNEYCTWTFWLGAVPFFFFDAYATQELPTVQLIWCL